MSNIQCFACGNAMGSESMVVKDYYHSRKDFELVSCPNCGLKVTQPKPPLEELPGYYATEKYVSHHKGEGGLFLFLYQLVQKWNLRLKRRGIASQGLRTGDLLDIGCGNGAALKYFNLNGWNGVGVEPADDARELANETGLRVFTEQFLESANSGSFDLITLWHVLEHVYDVPERLTQIRRLIKPSGLVVIALPNPAAWDASFYGKWWAAWDVPRHLSHFSKKSVVVLARNAQFEVVRVSPMWFDSFYIALTSEQNRRSGVLGIGRALAVGLWSNMVSAVRDRGTSSLVYYLRPLSQ